MSNRKPETGNRKQPQPQNTNNMYDRYQTSQQGTPIPVTVNRNRSLTWINYYNIFLDTNINGRCRGVRLRIYNPSYGWPQSAQPRSRAPGCRHHHHTWTRPEPLGPQARPGRPPAAAAGHEDPHVWRLSLTDKVRLTSHQMCSSIRNFFTLLII